MNHLEVWQAETHQSFSEARWLKWASEVERLADIDLDGNQEEDGYSIDFAYDRFLTGESADSYAESIIS